MTNDPRVPHAEARVAEARERLAGTVAALQVRINPRVIAREVANAASLRGTVAIEAGIAAVRRNPLKFAGLAALLLAVANHRTLASLGRRLLKAQTPAQPATRARVGTHRRGARPQKGSKA